METIKVIDGLTVVFAKIRNSELTQPFYILNKLFRGQDPEKELDDVLLEVMISPKCQETKETLFKNIIIEGFGRLSDPDAMDQVLEEKGLHFEAVLFSEAVMNYLGKFFQKAIEAGKSQPVKKDTTTQTK